MTTFPRSLVLAAAVAAGLGGAGNAFAQHPPGAPDRSSIHSIDKIGTQMRKERWGAPDSVHLQKSLMQKPVLGVLLAPDERSGVRIAGVTPDGGAAKAGLKAGDRLVSVDGRSVLGSTARLRVDNARRLLGKLSEKTPVKIGYERAGRASTASVTPRTSSPAIVWTIEDGTTISPQGDVRYRYRDDGGVEISADAIDTSLPPGVAPDIRREVIRVAPEGACKGKDCQAPMLMSAFRWNGLNLASVDAQLGRYFGTDHGVLVLSSGDLAGLQAGDVLQRVDGKPVTSPREVMAALRGKPDGARVAVDYLRDHKSGKAQITVPKLMALPFAPPPPAPPPPPPPPPAPPAPPKSA